MGTTVNNPATSTAGLTAAEDPGTAPASGSAPAPLTMREVLRVTTMRRLWYAQIVSILGDFLALFAVISVLTFRLHATPQQVTGLQIAYLLPIAVLSILAGVFVDRWPLKATLVASDFTRAGLSLLLLLATQYWHFYLILAMISTVSSFFGPAQGVVIRTTIPLHGLRSANTLMQQVMFGMRIVGPALAAFIVARFGEQTCYFADAASFLASGLLISTLAITRPPAKQQAEAQLETPPRSALASILPDMRLGISFIVHHAALLFIMLAFAASMFIVGCFGPLIAVYVRDSLHASTQVFGFSSAMIGVGMIVGGAAVNSAFKHLKNTTLVFTGLAGIALGLCLLTLLTHIWSTILANLIIGIAIAGIFVPSTAMIQQETPPELTGRVGSASMSLIFSAQILGLILSGYLANQIGVRHVFAVCAALLAIFIFSGALMTRKQATTVPRAISPS